MIVHNKHAEPWKVTVVDTGLNTQTGGRIKRIKEYIGNEEFMLTYGDAVGDINIKNYLNFIVLMGKLEQCRCTILDKTKVSLKSEEMVL